MTSGNVVMWVARRSIVDWVHVKTQTLLPREELYVLSEVEHLFPEVGSARSKRQSHSSTESEIISLDAGLRTDGLLALDLRDVVIEVLHSSKNTHQAV